MHSFTPALVKNAVPASEPKGAFGLGSDLLPRCVAGLNSLETLRVHLAAAHAARSPAMVEFVQKQADGIAEAEREKASQAARRMVADHYGHHALRLVDEEDFATLRSQLRMQLLIGHGITRLDFERMALAVASVRHCERSINAHILELARLGAHRVQIQAVASISAAILTAAQLLEHP